MENVRSILRFVIPFSAFSAPLLACHVALLAFVVNVSLATMLLKIF